VARGLLNAGRAQARLVLLGRVLSKLAEKEAVMSGANTTTNHKEIQKWVESRGGRPAHVKGTGGRNDVGILRIDYPGFSGEDTLEPLDWDQWFDAFEKNNLAFVYQDSVKGGSKSRFSKLVARDNVRSIGSARGGKAATPRRGGAAKRTAAKKTTTTRKTPRAAAARTSKRPTATKKRSAKKQSAQKQGAQGAVKQGSKKRSSSKKRSTSRG
jgi:hypothetical protein